MKRRSSLSNALAGMSITGASAAPTKVKAGDIATATFGKTGVKVSVIAQAESHAETTSKRALSGISKVYKTRPALVWSNVSRKHQPTFLVAQKVTHSENAKIGRGA